MSDQKQALRDAERSYDEDVSKAVEAGKEFIAEWPQISFIFNTNSEGGLTLSPQNPSVINLVDRMNNACGGMSLSSANHAFGRLQNEVIDSGRRVSRYKIGTQHVTEISPLLS